MTDNTIIVTTSWDDGHPLDIRLAELLASYGVKGTFYVPVKNGNSPILAKDQLIALKQIGMEIGSHTLTHRILTRLTRAEIFYEMQESKRVLEDICEEPITSICYPEGKFSRTVCSVPEKAGYRIGRTTRAFRTEIQFDPFCMPISFQFFPHTHAVLVRHAMNDRNLKGIANWVQRWTMQNDLIKLTHVMFDYVLTCGGVFHIWGHSWEIEHFQLWKQLEDVLQHISHQKGVNYLTNSQVLNLTSL